MRIVQQNGKWAASELFTTENLGFGAYQWIVEGNVYAMYPVTVLGLFTYGPAHTSVQTLRTKSTPSFPNGIKPVTDAMLISRFILRPDIASPREFPRGKTIFKSLAEP